MRRSSGCRNRAGLSLLAVALPAFALSAASYRVAEIDGRSCVVDPDGREYPVLGVNQVTAGTNAAETISCLKALGFNNLGGGGVSGLYHRGLSHTVFIGFDGVCYGTDPDRYICRANGGPMTAFPNVFHPDYAKWCDRLAAERCKPCADDGDLLGYFLDNELAWWGGRESLLDEGMFDTVRALPATHSARKALEAFVAGRTVTTALKLDFLELVAERYFAATAGAVRRQDSSHLVLGCRFAGAQGAHERVWKVAGRHCDVISLNLYPWVDLKGGGVFVERGGIPLSEFLSDCHRQGGRPLLLSEWSFPALDAGSPCTSGAGQRVSSQRARAFCVEKFLRTALASPHVVGTDFFMWSDRMQGSPENCNYGLVAADGRPYAEVAEAFRRVNGEAKSLRQAGTSRGGVRYERNGAVWTVSNDAGLVLSGRVGGEMVSSVTLGGVTFGSFGAMAELYFGGTREWIGTSETKEVGFARKGDSVVMTVSAVARGIRGKVRIVQRMTVCPHSTDVGCELLEVRNCGTNRIQLSAVYMRPHAVGKPGWREGTRPDADDGSSDFWRIADVGEYGMESADPALSKLAFSIDAGGWQHPDVRFVPADQVFLGPDEGYVPPSPYAAVLKVRRRER